LISFGIGLTIGFAKGYGSSVSFKIMCPRLVTILSTNIVSKLVGLLKSSIHCNESGAVWNSLITVGTIGSAKIRDNNPPIPRRTSPAIPLLPISLVLIPILTIEPEPLLSSTFIESSEKLEPPDYNDRKNDVSERNSKP
jgi:hypothetical protein